MNASVPKETRFTAARLWAAALENAKSWHDSGDADHHAKFACEKLPPENYVSHFLSRYDVARTVPKSRVDEFFKKIKDVSVKSSSSRCMADRASSINQVVGDGTIWAFKKKDGSGKISKKSRPLSAASKVSWFVAPKYWTLFDSYAQRALEERADDGKINGLDFIGFYERLDAMLIYELIDAINDILKEQKYLDFHDLEGSRVLDKLLWIMGSQDYYKTVSEITASDSLLIGQEIVMQTGQHALHKHLEKRWGVPIQ